MAEMTPLNDVPLHCEVVARTLPGLGTLSATTKPGFTATRTPEFIARGGDDIILTIIKQGAFQFSQFGREGVANAGEGLAVVSTNAGYVTASPCDYVALSVPRQVLAPVVHDVEARCVRPLRPGPVKLLMHYLAALH